MSERVIEFQVGGNVFWGDIFSGTPEQTAQQLAASLIDSGWGVRYANATWTAFNLSPRMYIYVTIGINVNSDISAEQLKQAILGHAVHYLDNVSITYTGDTIYNQNADGTVIVQDTYDKSNLDETPSIWEQIFGKDTSLTGGAGKVLGLSAGTLLLIGIGYLFITQTNKR